MPQNLRNADNRIKGPSRKISSGSNQKPSEPKHQYTATFKFERVTPEMLAEIKKAEMFPTVQGEKALRTAENLPRRIPDTDLIIILSAVKRDTKNQRMIMKKTVGKRRVE